MNELTGLAAGPGGGVIAGTCITRGCGADVILRQYGLSVCTYMFILYLCKILGRVTDAGKPVPVECGARTGYSMKVFQESWSLQVCAEGLMIIKDCWKSVLEKAGEQTGP